MTSFFGIEGPGRRRGGIALFIGLAAMLVSSPARAEGCLWTSTLDGRECVPYNAPPDGWEDAVMSPLAAEPDPSMTAEEMFQRGLALRKSRENVYDHENAIYTWMRRAADLGHSEAQFQVGRLILDNYFLIGVSYADAAYSFRRAAEQGHANAQFEIAKMYQSGRGVPVDRDMAKLWYRKAADQGHGQALTALLTMPQ